MHSSTRADASFSAADGGEHLDQDVAMIEVYLDIWISFEESSSIRALNRNDTDCEF